MMPKPPTPPKKRVTLFVWVSLIIDIISDLLKFILFLLQALGLATGIFTIGVGAAVGVAIDFAGSLLLSFIEILAGASNFFASGLYRRGNGTMANIILAGTTFALELVPEVDDFPIASFTTIIAIFNAKRAEKQDQKEYQAELKKYNDAIASIQSAQIRRAQQAAQNAATVPENIRLAA